MNEQFRFFQKNNRNQNVWGKKNCEQKSNPLRLNIKLKGRKLK